MLDRQSLFSRMGPTKMAWRRWCLRKQLHGRRVIGWIDNEASHKYNLTDGGVLDAAADIVGLMLDLHQPPYNTALQNWGPIN